MCVSPLSLDLKSSVNILIQTYVSKVSILLTNAIECNRIVKLKVKLPQPGKYLLIISQNIDFANKKYTIILKKQSLTNTKMRKQYHENFANFH